MNNRILCALALTAGSWFCTHAHAAPKVTLHPYPAHQVGISAYARVGLLVLGESSWTSLTVGGGFTLTCGAQTVYAENSTFAPFTAGPTMGVVYVPAATYPADYNIGGFSGLAGGACRHCSFQYRGRVLEGLATINATSHGAGFVFTVGGVEITQADTQTFDICKPQTTTSGAGCLK